MAGRKASKCPCSSTGIRFSILPRRVRIALREKQIACEEVEVDLPGGATRAPAFRRLNPFGQVPVLADGELVIYESLAILEYLEERFPTPALLPAEVGARALVLRRAASIETMSFTRFWPSASLGSLIGHSYWIPYPITPDSTQSHSAAPVNLPVV